MDASELHALDNIEYREPRPFGRCTCGRQSYTVDENGKPMHACCVRLGEDCEACAVADVLDKQGRSRSVRTAARNAHWKAVAES